MQIPSRFQDDDELGIPSSRQQQQQQAQAGSGLSVQSTCTAIPHPPPINPSVLTTNPLPSAAQQHAATAAGGEGGVGRRMGKIEGKRMGGGGMMGKEGERMGGEEEGEEGREI